jgi:hypothetical protein
VLPSTERPRSNARADSDGSPRAKSMRTARPPSSAAASACAQWPSARDRAGGWAHG